MWGKKIIQDIEIDFSNKNSPTVNIEWNEIHRKNMVLETPSIRNIPKNLYLSIRAKSKVWLKSPHMSFHKKDKTWTLIHSIKNLSI